MRQPILNYSISHAADKAPDKRSKKIMALLNNDKVPTRIAEVGSIRRKQREISSDLIKCGQVNPLSFGDAQVVFAADTVSIPGKGKRTW